MDAELNRWSECLRSDSLVQQTEVLRQIAARSGVRGFAVRCVELAGSHDDEVRLWAAEALEAGVCPQPDEVGELAHLLATSADGEVAYWAAMLLGRLGPTASDATPELEACLQRSLYLPARERAAWALSRIGPKAVAAMPTLSHVAAGGPPRLRRLALQALDSIRGVAA